MFFTSWYLSPSSSIIRKGALKIWRYFIMHSHGWLHHIYWRVFITITPRFWHWKCSLNASSHHWHQHVRVFAVNKSWWFIGILLWVNLVLCHFFFFLWSQAHTYYRKQIQVGNRSISIVKFYNFDLSNVLAMDCLSEPVVSYLKSFHQTCKSLSHKICNLASHFFLPNIPLVLGILHW